MKGIFKHCLDCGREGKDSARPISEFYKGEIEYSQYCKVHMQKRGTASREKRRLRKIKLGQIRQAWPSPLVWPRIQGCGTKAQCKDQVDSRCKERNGIWSLERFNHTAKQRKDGSIKKKPHCCYCQSTYNRKYNMIKAHKKREEARQSA